MGTPEEPEIVPPLTDAEIQQILDDMEAQLDADETARQADVTRIAQEVADRNVQAMAPVDFQEFADANGITVSVPTPEVPPDSIDAPTDPDPDPVPLPDGHEYEPPNFQPGPMFPIVDYPAEPGA